ncbi:MAG: UbiA family prenyltransferase [Actinobacteria bacterium]|nr:UbiA family prenyltransferase [Actinomycetota bacterium]
MLFGSFSAYIFFNASITYENIKLILIALLCTCLASSANYGINELIDSEFDKHHPVKKKRPIPSGKISKKKVFAGSLLLGVITAVISFFFLPIEAFFAILSLMVMGFLYNVRPFRTKELTYIDVISESINNPIRFVIGWYAMQMIFFPPVSFIISFWAFGAFLMACKRLAEYRFINDPQKAAKYRKSFKYYTEENLIVSIIGYISLVSFSLAIICIKYSISVILAAPVFITSFIWYFKLTLKKDSPAKEPEKLLKQKEFYFFTILTMIVMILAKILNPYLEFLLKIWS